MSKEKLVLDYFEDDFLLYGIISDVKEFKLAWQLNQCFQLDFVLQEDAELVFKGNKKMFISYYIADEEHFRVKLIKNRAVESEGVQSPFVLPELKNYDYLLMVEGEDYDAFEQLSPSDQFNKGSFVQYSNTIDIDSLKSVDNLIF